MEVFSAKRSLGITAISAAATFFLSLATVVIVSRLLSPTEIGVFSVSVAMIGFMHTLREFGVSQYLMQIKEITRDDKRAAFTITLAFSWLIALALHLIKDTAATFYGEVGIARVMELMAVNFLILPFAAFMRALLHRDLQFKKMAVIDLSNSIMAAIGTITAAWMGFSYLSMACGAIAGNIAAFFALLLLSNSRTLDWPTTRGLANVLNFGSRWSAASFISQIGTAAPDLILGRTLGFAEVAFLSRANGVLSMALSQLRVVVQAVYSPVFAKGYREGLEVGPIFLNFNQMLLAIVLPMLGMMALLSSQLIEFMFGHQWARSAPLASILCIFAIVGAPMTLAPYSLISMGKVGLLMRCRIVIEFFRVASLLSSIYFSLEIVVLIQGAITLIEVLIFRKALHSSFGLTWQTLTKELSSSYALVPLTVLLPAWAVILLRQADIHYALLELIIAGTLGLLSWAIALQLLKHPMFPEIQKLYKNLGVRFF